MKRPLRWYDYITINIYWFGLSTIAQTLTPLVFPLLIQDFVGEETKGTFLGTLRLWSLMIALLSQALWGMLSDHSTSRWGRRRPFIFGGTLADLVFMIAIGFSASLTGMTGYWFLLITAILIQISSNAAHGAEQGLIPDLVPEEKRGRFSSVKAIFEIPLPVIFVAFVAGPLIAKGNIWTGILVAMATVTLCMLITMLVPEQPSRETLSKLDWAPILRLALMTGLFTVVILGMGEVIKFLWHPLESISTTHLLLIITGAIGLLTMTVAVALGVWASVRISIGKDAQRNTSFTWWIVNRLAFLVGTTNLSGFAVYYFQGRLGYAEEQAAEPASQLMMVVGLFILLSAFLSGWLSDKIGHKQLVAISGLLAATGTLIIILTTNMMMIYIGGCTIGVGAGLFFTANWALGTDLVPKSEAGRYLGISNLAGAGAGAVGAYIGGPIADFITTQVPEVPGLGYVLLFAIYGILFLFSVAALTQVKRKSPMVAT